MMRVDHMEPKYNLGENISLLHTARENVLVKLLESLRIIS